MSCNIAIGANRTEPCTFSNGGIAEFFPFAFVENAFTVVDGIATSKSADLTTAYKYAIKGDNNTFNDVGNGNPKIGNFYTEQTFVADLIKIDGATNFELTKLQQGKHSGVFKDKNDVYHVIGHENGFNESTVVDSVIEGSVDGFNGYKVTLVSRNKVKAPVLDDATRDAFLAIVTA